MVRSFAQTLIAVAGLLGIIAGCTKTDVPKEEKPPETPSRDSVVATRVAPPPIAGPRLVIDSAAMHPFLAMDAGELRLHLPTEMAKVLMDSLPAFALVERSAYDTSLVRWADERVTGARKPGLSTADSLGLYALSAAVGDFDGDSTADVAMRGISRDSSAIVFILSRSQARREPQLIFIERPSPVSHTERQWVFLTRAAAGPIRVVDDADTSLVFQLHTDGVEVVYFEKGAQVFYLDHGVLRSVITSD